MLIIPDHILDVTDYRKDYRFKSGFLVLATLDTDVMQFYQPKINLLASESEAKSVYNNAFCLMQLFLERQKPDHSLLPSKSPMWKSSFALVQPEQRLANSRSSFKVSSETHFHRLAPMCYVLLIFPDASLFM